MNMTKDYFRFTVQVPNIRFLMQKDIEKMHGEVYKAKAELDNITTPQLQIFMEPPALEIALPDGVTLPEGIDVPEGIILTSSAEDQVLITLPMDDTTEEQTMVTLLADTTQADLTGDEAFVTLPVDASLASETGYQAFEGQVFIHPSIQEGRTVIQLVPGSA